MTVAMALCTVTLDLWFSLHAPSCSSYKQEIVSSYCIIGHLLFCLHASFLLMMFCAYGFGNFLFYCWIELLIVNFELITCKEGFISSILYHYIKLWKIMFNPKIINILFPYAGRQPCHIGDAETLPKPKRDCRSQQVQEDVCFFLHF